MTFEHLCLCLIRSVSNAAQERSRITVLLRQAYDVLKPNMPIVHFSQERCLNDFLERMKLIKYIKADVRKTFQGIPVTYFDITKEIQNLPYLTSILI